MLGFDKHMKAEVQRGRMPFGGMRGDGMRADAVQVLKLLAVSVLGAFIFQWPLLVYGKPNVFMEDSIHYVKHGQIMWDRLGSLLSSLLQESAAQSGPAAASAGGGGGSGSAGGGGLDLGNRLAAATGDVVKVRSIPYALFAAGFYATPIGAMGTLIAQTAVVLFCFAAVFVDMIGRPRAMMAAALLLMLAGTTLPIYATFLMPDTLAAAILLYAILISRGTEHLGPLTLMALMGAAAFATISHHGFLPLAVSVIGAALVVLALFGRLTWVALALGIVPIVLPMLLNLGGSAVAFGESSVAPRRMPFLITRSISDGPARWHLEEHCPAAGYHICEVFSEGIPERYGQIMWGKRGLAQLPLEDLDEVRAEESTIVMRAFLEYPIQQSIAFLQRAFHLLPMVTVEGYFAGRPRMGDGGIYVLPRSEAELIPLPEWWRTVHRVVIVGSLGLLLWLIATGGRVLGSKERRIILVLSAGIALNALVFGGLSAVDPRYQTRVGWLIPACAAALLLARTARREQQLYDEVAGGSLAQGGARSTRAEP